ncbi:MULTISPECIES: RluA family pseudouridine synthase [Paenibacillus]|uniref:RluA family pseudouridine synthase n=1 Tax=Paenibacillus TaxID=44249 RepID=UPI00203C1C2D|nr:RNA pseudouridine synthase [Paenibacillus camelliae]MCM3632979.1 RNA pseudouridine synthase [Paenibacillus camelliae]
MKPAIPILYEDNHIIVVEKPPGIPSQEDDTGDADMLTLIKDDIKLRYQKPGNVFLGLVHRLDRPVGGAMIFAKTSKAASRLSDAVRTRTFGKTYMCIVEGIPVAQEADLLHYIRKDSKKNQVTVFNQPVAEAKDARLSYRVIASNNGTSLVSIQLHTGRPHQIRAQMAFIGHPLLGDVKYGKAAKQRGHGTIALWSTSVTAPHPTSKEVMSFTSLPNSAEAPWSHYTAQQLQQAVHWYT